MTQAKQLAIRIGEAFRVQEIPLLDGRSSYAVYDTTYQRPAPIDDYLRYLDRTKKSPNTVSAYATGLKWFWTWMEAVGRSWHEVDLAGLAEFHDYLVYGPAAVEALPTQAMEVKRGRSSRSVYMTAVYEFYEYMTLKTGLLPAFPVRLPAQHGRAGARPIGARPVKRLPRALTMEEVRAIIDAQHRLRDRLLLLLMVTTGMRIGTALSLRHEDFQSWNGIVQPVLRPDPPQRARHKSKPRDSNPIEPSAKFLTDEVVRLYGDYMFTEYGDFPSDHIFVNIWSGRRGAPLTYDSVRDLIERTRRVVGFYFTIHWLRHTFATVALESGVTIESVSELMDHSSLATTKDIYGHLTPEHLRRELETAGILRRAWAVQ